MSVVLGVVMDPPSAIHYDKDSKLAMLWEADRRGWTLFYLAPEKIFSRDGQVFAEAARMQVCQNSPQWATFAVADRMPLTACDVILVRKDPPFDTGYLYLTQLLEQAERAGVQVINRPQALRDANEKLFALQFPECCPPTVVSADKAHLTAFLKEHRDIVCKPLDGMGGRSILRLREQDENASVVFEMLTANETRWMLAQCYLPDIAKGDKRILMIDGEPVPYALARIPRAGELRGNLAAGGRGIAQPLTERDRWIASVVGPVLREKGLMFVGLDVIGDWLTEINVTSPTCIRELDQQTGSVIASQLLDRIEALLD